ncbi:MAG: bi-domain-containing oxidoreductase [Candidatus Omnitrophota bacterium]
MKQILIKKGKIYAEDVPVPTVSKDSVLVEVEYSCISAGTELSNIYNSKQTIMEAAIKQPKKIEKAIDTLKNEGFLKTIRKINNFQKNSEQVQQLGYSAAGRVIEVGENISDIIVGDMVACGGAGVANHAEYIEVPRNLLVKLSAGIELDLASTVSLGAIALQSVRRADVKIGEYVAVIGLGILGQITAQLLKANGCRVMGVDINQRRIKKALALGLDKAIDASCEDVVTAAVSFANGLGVDAVIITASDNSSTLLNQSFQISRKKGKVVVVGAVGMEIDRERMYRKELDLLISTSYGPGRYDENYEQKGIDYPYAYVRWTETRNMQAYLNLIADEKINIRPLVEEVYEIEDVEKAYACLSRAEDKPLIVLLKYSRRHNISKIIEVQPRLVKKNGLINIAVIGAGNLAKGVHLPNLMKLKKLFNIYAIVSKTASNAKITAQQFGAQYATTDFRKIIEDEKVDAVLIATRHDLHAEMARESLLSGKAVFLEKPMAIHKEELDKLVKLIKDKNLPFMAGFNRRFSPYAREIKKHILSRVNPLIINYQMNAGYISPEHWVYSEEGGGRIIGEACHIFDLFTYFTDSTIKTVSLDRLTPKTDYYKAQDNIVITLQFTDGSVGTLLYTTLGPEQYPKEMCNVFCDNKVFVIKDYKQLEGYGISVKNVSSAYPDKGQYEELIEFARFVRGDIEQPIPLWQMVQTTEISIDIEKNKY